MGSVEWVPKTDVPNNLGFFQKGETVTGLPYSSVKELQKFIGLDVSIYTFLTAVNNPHSLLYTQNVAAGNPCYLGGTYKGKNSHTFYGTVCSSFTAFCYGEDNNYASFNYRNGQVPNYYLKPDQSIECVEGGDLYWCPGHVALITGVEKDSSGSVKKIQLFESAGDKVNSRIYTPLAFSFRLSGSGNPKNKGYLYGNKLIKRVEEESMDTLSKQAIQKILNNLELGSDEICTWFGDKPCIGEWDKVVINFSKKNYDRIIISLDDNVVDTLDISKADHSIEYSTRGAGIYKANLASDSEISSNYTSFEVLDTTTKIQQMEDGSVEVFFAANSDPEFVYWVNDAGEQYTFPTNVPVHERNEGRMRVKSCTKKGVVLRVIYRGKFGRAINKPTHLFRE